MKRLILLCTLLLSLDVSAQSLCKEEIGKFDSKKEYTFVPSIYLIKPGQCLVSPNRKYVATMQETDGNFVLRYTVNGTLSPNNFLWHTETGGHPGAGLYVQADGHFVVYKPKPNGTITPDIKQAIFESNKMEKPDSNYVLALRNDGAFFLYRGTDPQTPEKTMFSTIKAPNHGGQCWEWRCEGDGSGGQHCGNVPCT